MYLQETNVGLQIGVVVELHRPEYSSEGATFEGRCWLPNLPYPYKPSIAPV